MGGDWSVVVVVKGMVVLRLMTMINPPPDFADTGLGLLMRPSPFSKGLLLLLLFDQSNNFGGNIPAMEAKRG